ncbi:MAG: hypothetical protein M1817_002394 [Caeruleum heppii]|nr:MAG: hypothetical protein M1817_002394 [Caeruleum heppii]
MFRDGTTWCLFVGLGLVLLLFLYCGRLLTSGPFFYTSSLNATTALSNITHASALASLTGLKSALSTKKVATIIENRSLTNLVPLILHFVSVLGPDWPIRVFHSPENAALFSSSASFQKLVSTGQITLSLLPNTTTFSDFDAVSEYLTRPAFWEALAPADNVLFFQADSILCSNAQQRVEDFFAYDFIGAPIDPSIGHGFNGGLSLRNRNKMVEVLQHFDWKDTRGFEDQWFFEKLRALPPTANGGPGANIPSVEVAKTFSVETMWHPQPLGVHQVRRWQKDRLTELARWCPEYQLASEGKLYQGGGSRR